MQPGHRVLIRSANNPAMVACWLAATKAGAVVVNTMPMLRAGELAQIVDKAEVAIALCDTRLMDELVACAKESRFLTKVIGFDGTANHDAELDRAALEQVGDVRSGEDRPRRRRAARVHVGDDGRTESDDALPSRPADHRRQLCEGRARSDPRRRVRRLATARVHVRSRRPGGVPVAVRRSGHAARERVAGRTWSRSSRPTRPRCASPRRPPIGRCWRRWTKGPTCRRCAPRSRPARRLPAPVYEAWMDRTGKPMLDGIGATELLHIFISNRFGDSKPACTGTPVRGYQAKVVDDDMQEVPRNTVGRLAVRGPTGCRYLADDRQRVVRARRLEPDGRLVHAGRRRLLPLRRPFGRHDHLGRVTTSPGPRSRRRCCHIPTSSSAR